MSPISGAELDIVLLSIGYVVIYTWGCYFISAKSMASNSCLSRSTFTVWVLLIAVVVLAELTPNKEIADIKGTVCGVDFL